MTIDTNIIIACLEGELHASITLSEWRKTGQALFISSITLAETLAFAPMTDFQLESAKAFLSNFVSIPFEDSLAERAAKIRRIYNLELPDAAIAATALSRNTPLVTRDRQFRKIRELTVIEV